MIAVTAGRRIPCDRRCTVRSRPPHDFAGHCDILRNCVTSFHLGIIHQDSSNDIGRQMRNQLKSKGAGLKTWPKYSIREVDGHDDEIADTLTDLHRLTFFDSASIPNFEHGHWWLAFHRTIPIAFAGLAPSTRVHNAGYFCRVGVLKSHCGNALQLRLMRAMELRARHNGWSTVVSDTTGNLVSANNFIRAGYSLYQPPNPWGWPTTLYWRKHM
jgi:hypothetical protein